LKKKTWRRQKTKATQKQNIPFNFVSPTQTKTLKEKPG